MSEENNTPNNVVVLSDGRKAEFHPFKGKHTREAQKVSDGDSSKMIFAMIAVCCTIDGHKIVLEDLDDMPGGDVLKLQAKFSELNF